MTGGSLPPYAVRVSDRARRVNLTVTARHGLVVVVPRAWRGDAGAIVASKRAWAQRALAHVAEDRALHLGGAQALLPRTVELRFTGETLTVAEGATGSGTAARVARRGDTLVFFGDPDPDARLAALRRWLDRETRDVLPARAAALAEAHGFLPKRIRVTRARSRWGSCSAKGTVSLNRALVFLPPELVDALILHELAHLRVMNHSARFWAELQRFDPDALRHRTELKGAMSLVPPWAEA